MYRQFRQFYLVYKAKVFMVVICIKEIFHQSNAFFLHLHLAFEKYSHTKN